MTDEHGDATPLTPEQEAEVSALLASLPDPPMPDDVVARIDTALAGAREGHSAVTTLPAAEPSRVWRPRGTWLLQAAAVVVLLVLGAGVTYGLVAGDDSDDTPAVTALEDGSGAPVEVTSSGLDHTADTVSQNVRSLLAPTSSAESASPGDESSQALALGGTTADEAREPPENGAGAAAADGRKKGADRTPAQRVLPEGQTDRAVRALMEDPERRAACLRELSGGDDVVPLLVDVARFDGRPAAVLVLPLGDGGDRAEVWVVGATCSSADEPFPLYWAIVRLP